MTLSLGRNERLSAAEFSEIRNPGHVLVDVRTEPELQICAIENSINIPMEELDKVSMFYSSLRH
jgi:rhodanese-related sulfurtransferase